MSKTATQTLYRFMRADQEEHSPDKALKEILAHLDKPGGSDEDLVSLIYDFGDCKYNEGFIDGYNGAKEIFARQ